MPQFLPTRSGFSAVADEMQQVLLERALAAKQAEAEAYKRKQDELKFGLDARETANREAQTGIDRESLGLRSRQLDDAESQRQELLRLANGTTPTTFKAASLPQGAGVNPLIRLGRVDVSPAMAPAAAKEFAPGITPERSSALRAQAAGANVPVNAFDAPREKSSDLVPVWRNGKQVWVRKTEGITSDPAPSNREPSYVWITKPDGSQERVLDRPGLVSSKPPTKTADGTSDDANRMVDEALSAINTLRTSPAFDSGFSGAVGAPALNWRSLINIPSEIFKGRPAAGTPEADFARQFEALKAKVTLPNLQMMKGMGALSDAEGKRIEAASITADRATSETEFLRALKDIEDTLKAAQQRQKNRGLGMGVNVGQAGAPRRVKATIDANGNIVVAR